MIKGCRKDCCFYCSIMVTAAKTALQPFRCPFAAGLSGLPAVVGSKIGPTGSLSVGG
jgi:hypothetical protein